MKAFSLWVCICFCHLDWIPLVLEFDIEFNLMMVSIWLFSFDIWHTIGIGYGSKDCQHLLKLGMLLKLMLKSKWLGNHDSIWCCSNQCLEFLVLKSFLIQLEYLDHFYVCVSVYNLSLYFPANLFSWMFKISLISAPY